MKARRRGETVWTASPAAGAPDLWWFGAGRLPAWQVYLSAVLPHYRYRGEHRDGAWTVGALTESVIAQRSVNERAHRRSLRRPIDVEPHYFTIRNVRFTVFPPPNHDAMEGVLLVVPPAGSAFPVNPPAMLPAKATAKPAADCCCPIEWPTDTRCDPCRSGNHHGCVGL